MGWTMMLATLTVAAAGPPSSTPAPEYHSKAAVFESAAAAASALVRSTGVVDQYGRLSLSVDQHRRNAKENVRKLVARCPDTGLASFLNRRLASGTIGVPMIVKAVRVGQKAMWAVVLAWEDEAMAERGQALELGHIEVFILEAATGRELAYDRCA